VGDDDDDDDKCRKCLNHYSLYRNKYDKQIIWRNTTSSCVSIRKQFDFV